ncbi:MAG: SUMF1/EgtB/PvdO family nonheme iron enzyme [Polyangiales bacterium]
MSRARVRALLVAGAILALPFGCQAIAGIEELQLRSDAGGEDTGADSAIEDTGGDTSARPDTAVVTDGDATIDTSVLPDTSPVFDGDAVVDTATVADTLDGALPDTAPPPCPTKGQTMARITHVTGNFCIDKNEVTVAQMETFAGSPFAPPVRPAACGTIPTWYDDPAGRPTDPAYNVKWCSAWAYCNWAGKRLCGRLDTTAVASATNSEYAWTCANGKAAYPYPYGATFSTTACDAETGRSTPDLVTSHPLCHGATAPYQSVLNLSGSEAEWTDDCPDSTHCWVRGGYYGDLRTNATCTSFFALSIGVEQAGNGFRCCSD